jgi:hypothetical protein
VTQGSIGGSAFVFNKSEKKGGGATTEIAKIAIDCQKLPKLNRGAVQCIVRTP